MPESELLHTKLFIPPPRPARVPRPRLIEQLYKGLYRKMTLISAPAGFGKTTLVSEWADALRSDDHKGEQIENRVCWLSLDEGDNDPARFLSYLIAAIKQIEGLDPSFGKGLLSMLQSPQSPPTEGILTSLINELTTINFKIILVLDDYHLINAQSVHDALEFLLEKIPPQVHLVIATRVDPQFPLARLRAQDQLSELRAKDLRFTSSEVAEFLNEVMGLNLSLENVTALDSRTEGWIGGLQLAAISMKGHRNTTEFIESFTGSHRFVIDYLVEDVLEQQPDMVQSFLVQTTILDRLNGSLCDALTGRNDGQKTLEYLEQANLFIVPLDNERKWYRYHHLLSQMLRQRLNQKFPEKTPALHQKASAWYEKQLYVDQAIKHALLGKDYQKAVDLISVHFDSFYQQGQHMKLRGWLAELPVELECSNPQICLIQAWDQFTSGRMDEAERSLQDLDKLIDSGKDRTQFSGEETQQLVGRAATIRAFLASYGGDIVGTLNNASKALKNLPEADLYWRCAALIAQGDAFSIQGEVDVAYEARVNTLSASKAAGDIYLLLIATTRLAETLREQGKLRQIVDLCQEQIRIAEQSGLSETVVAGYMLAIWGEVLAEFNQLQEAKLKASEGVRLTELGSDVAMIGWSNLRLVRILYSIGDYSGAEVVIKKTMTFAQENKLPHWVPAQMSAWQARIWLAHEQFGAVSDWVEDKGLTFEAPSTYQHETEHVVYARLLISQGRMNEGEMLLRRLLEAAEQGGRVSRMIEINNLLACALKTAGESSRAMDSLKQALTLAEPRGFIRIFLDDGSQMARLLKEALNHGIAVKYVNRLLSAFSSQEPGQSDPTTIKVDQAGLIEPLSEREIEVLQYIADGLTNREIADRLYLSINTVKVHTRNIYGKLGVNNRTQAVSKAREEGVLPSS